MSTPIRPPGLADHLILLRNRLLEHERLSTEAAPQRPTPEELNQAVEDAFGRPACPPPEEEK